jgi:hypothetical protein
MQKSYLLFLAFISLGFAANGEKILTLKTTNQEIKIDGVIDNQWSMADSITDFFQQQPYYGKTPSKRTVAKVITTETNLYALIKCYDDPQNIQVNKGTLDEFTGDIVSLMIDTFGDGRTAYKFAVSASGVRSDCRLLDDARNRDYSWDGIWFAASQVYNWGFVVEIKVPYKSIQYDEKLTAWGLDFDRWIPTNTEDLYWGIYEEDEGQRVSKFGKLLLNEFRPSIKGLNLEIYPVGIAKAQYLYDTKYDIDPNAGLDIFYNPSPKLTFQLTANPDFAQIEADPFDFNISRYESYFSERRPFFTEGNEVFMPAGKQRNTGFYTPLELFYSRRIGKKLPDGGEVPLIVGTKAFGRINDWEYGGFVAVTGEKDYMDEDQSFTEDQAVFASARIKKQIFENSSVGILYAGKHSNNNDYGVIDIDGALRTSKWQLAYQLARSYKNNSGDFAGAAGFTMIKPTWLTFIKGRYVGNKFDVDQIGFVPWKGSSELVGLTGPRWYYEEGYIRSILIYGGGFVGYEKVDDYMDKGGLIGFNMQFRNNWGYEINLDAGRSKDENVLYDAYSITLSTWFNTSPKWSGDVWTGYQKTYNFSRDYLAFYSWIGSEFNWNALTLLKIGTSLDVFIEGNPDAEIEDVTYNARPFFSLTPINNLNVRMYLDNVFVRSSDKLEQTIFGFLFSYNFSPKSWIYLAINEFRDRSREYDMLGNPKPKKMHIIDRAAVLKVSYLYYF